MQHTHVQTSTPHCKATLIDHTHEPSLISPWDCGCLWAPPWWHSGTCHSTHRKSLGIWILSLFYLCPCQICIRGPPLSFKSSVPIVSCMLSFFRWGGVKRMRPGSASGHRCWWRNGRWQGNQRLSKPYWQTVHEKLRARYQHSTLSYCL